MEHRDLYDKNRKLTGEKIRKEDAVPNGRYYITVIVWILNSENKFLLQINKKYNLWQATGGHPKTGETSIEGIVTEIKEELGLKINKEDFKLLKTIKTEDDFVDVYYLKLDVKIEEMNLEKEEVGDVKWFSKDDIDKLIENKTFQPAHIEFYHYCLEYLNRDCK